MMEPVKCDRVCDETAAAPAAGTEFGRVQEYAWSDEQPVVERDGEYVLTWRETLATPAGRLFIAAAVVLVAVIAWWCVVASRRAGDPPAPAAGVPYTIPASALTPPVPAEPPPAPPPAEPAPVPPVARADPDERFLAMVTDAGLTVTDRHLAVSGAREVCGYLAAGHTQADAVRKTMQNNPSLPEPAATAFVRAATQVYCEDRR